MPVKLNMNMKTLKVIAIVLLVVIVLGAGIYWMVSGMSNRGLEGFETATTIPAPPTPSTILENFRKANNTDWKVGKKHTFRVTGTATNNTTNRIWGGGDALGTYTLDSPIAVAAVHAGIVPINKSGIVTIEITKGLDPYIASTRNGILSNKYGKYEGSYRFEQDSRFISQLEIGKTYAFKITGTTGWGIWGGGDVLATYTADSPIVTAAVHAGIIKETEDKEITILILPGINTYIGVTRNGITSSNFGKYDKAYRFIDPALPVLNQDLGKIQSKLEQKNNNLATAQSELAAASAALNNAIKSASVEGFQTAGTTAQVISPIMAKINQLKAIQAQKAADYTKAKSELEAVKTAQAVQITGLESNKAALETEKLGLQSNKAALETEKLGLKSNKAALETEKLGLQSNKAKLAAEINAAETKLDLINQRLGAAVSTFQDISPTSSAGTSLADKLTSLESQISLLTNAKAAANTEIATLKAELATTNANLTTANQVSTKLTGLEVLLQGAQFQTGDSTGLATELARARYVLNNPPADVVCPPVLACPPLPPPPPPCPTQQACPDTSGMNTQITDLMNSNASLGREIDTKDAHIIDLEGKLGQKMSIKDAQIIDLEGKLGIAATTVKQLDDKIANFDKALTDADRQKLTDAKNAAELAILEIKKTLGLTEAERDLAMNTMNELKTKYEACESASRNKHSESIRPVFGGPMGGMTPSYVCNPMQSMGDQVQEAELLPISDNISSVLSTKVRLPIRPPAELFPIPDNIAGVQSTKVRLPIRPPAELFPLTYGIADTSLSAATGFTDIPKQQLQFQNARSNPRWTYRPESYDSHDRYAAPLMHWVTGFNA